MLFGDRSPVNHEKVRLISKSQTQMFWLMIVNDSLRRNQFFIEQQIPKNLPNTLFENKLKLLKNEQDFFKRIVNEEFDEFVFSSEGIINDDGLEDIWSLYKIEDDRDCYQSLDSLLYKTSFDAKNDYRHYLVEHGDFYNVLCKYNGIKHLATLIHKVCLFLAKLKEIGLIYGNLRPENIVIKFDKYKSRIERVKFIDFGCVT